MAFDFYMPDIGEGVVEGEIVGWKVKEGDRVKLDQPIVEVMTDKATVELPSPRAGVIKKINYKDGEICPVGKVLVVIDEEGASAAATPAAGGNGKKQPAMIVEEPPRKAPTTAQVMHSKVAQNVPLTSPTSSSASSSGAIQVVDATADRERVLATPATRRLARQLGVEIGRVPATGKHGRVTTDDVKRFKEAPSGAPAAQARTAYTPVSIAKGGDEERIPLRGIRKKIAESMTRSVQTAAHFTYVEEVDMTELVAVRDRAKSRATERGVKLNYLPFIVKAVVSGLKKWPMLNASLDESTQEIVRKKYYHIGIAAQGPQGLAVSVVRDADKRSIFDLSKEIERLGEAVRTGTATREELTGSTFTISSLGKLGGVLATPIINFPEVAIIGVHKIEERPAVRNGQIVARHLMNLSISVDHRLADGWDGAMFLQDVKALLEDPTTMFMEMV
ncbi:MAG TPA: dihydrolipoamide acetyltransferase family protein [Kofleriaceae bacterium]|nr:dihydrolipoamide acetyltransferase family protein [Kofleriaceae bacterium]